MNCGWEMNNRYLLFFTFGNGLRGWRIRKKSEWVRVQKGMEGKKRNGYIRIFFKRWMVNTNKRFFSLFTLTLFNTKYGFIFYNSLFFLIVFFVFVCL